jgi:hypothetical protein
MVAKALIFLVQLKGILQLAILFFPLGVGKHCILLCEQFHFVKVGKSNHQTHPPKPNILFCK